MLKSWVAIVGFCGLMALPLNAFAFGDSILPHLEEMPAWKPSGTTLGQKKTGEVQQRLNKIRYYASFAKSEIDEASAPGLDAAGQCGHLRAARSYTTQIASLAVEIKTIVGPDPFGEQTDNLNAVDRLIETDSELGNLIASQCPAAGSAPSQPAPAAETPAPSQASSAQLPTDLPQLVDSLIVINYICQSVQGPESYQTTRSDILAAVLKIDPDQNAALKMINAAESDGKDLCADPSTCWTQAVLEGEPVTKAQAKKDCGEALAMGMDLLSQDVAAAKGK